MAKRYKLSEGFMDKFWGLFHKDNTPKPLQVIINNDPTLKKLQDEWTDLNTYGSSYLKKVKKTDPDIYSMLKNMGLVP